MFKFSRIRRVFNRSLAVNVILALKKLTRIVKTSSINKQLFKLELASMRIDEENELAELRLANARIIYIAMKRKAIDKESKGIAKANELKCKHGSILEQLEAS